MGAPSKELPEFEITVELPSADKEVESFLAEVEADIAKYEKERPRDEPIFLPEDQWTPEQKSQAMEQRSHWEKEDERQANYVDSQEHQNSLYPMPPVGLQTETVVHRSSDKRETVMTGVADPVQAIMGMHPEMAAAASKYDALAQKPTGRELEQMRKYFGQGTGMYLVTVNFQLARTEAFKLDLRAQRKILKALKPKAKKRPKKTVAKPKVKPKAKKKK